MLIARLPEEWINSTGPHASPRSLFESQFTGTYNGPNPFASRPTETCLTRSPLYNSRLTAVSWEIRGHFPRSRVSKILAEGWRVGETDLGILNVGGENWERRPSVGRSRWEIGNGSREKFDSCSFYVTRGRGRHISEPVIIETSFETSLSHSVFPRPNRSTPYLAILLEVKKFHVNRHHLRRSWIVDRKIFITV